MLLPRGRQCGPLPCGWVADVEATIGEGEQERPIARGADLEVTVVVVIVETEDGLALGGGSPEVEGVDEVAAVETDVVVEENERERRLAQVVGAEEVEVGGDEAQPGAADRAAAEERRRRQADEDLPDDELLRKDGGSGAADPRTSCACGFNHGPGSMQLRLAITTSDRALSPVARRRTAI